MAASSTVGDVWGQARWLVQLSNDLVAADVYTKVLMVAEPPRSVSPEWDAAIAGIVEWRLAQAGLPAPEWVSDVAGDATRKWSIWAGSVYAEAEEVPEPLLRRGVWVGEGELDSV